MQLTSDVTTELMAHGLHRYQQLAYATALPFFEILVEAEPQDAALLKVLASCHQHLGRTRPAIEFYQRALALRPDDTDVLANLAQLLIAQVRLDEAIELLARAIAQDPGYRDPFAQRARALVMQVVAQFEDDQQARTGSRRSA